jgi:DNA-binding XRE family transcriptional regulator
MSRPIPITQIIVTPEGHEMVVLPRTEYDRLVSLASEAAEDAADAELYDRRKAEFEAGGREVLPPEVSALMLAGAGRIKALRKWRGASQQDIAARAGLAQGYLSDIEAGRKKGAPEMLARIAVALDVPSSWLS